MEGFHSSWMIFSLALLLGSVAGQGRWRTRDSFDEIQDKMDKVTADNCLVTSVDDLFLPKDAVSHHPEGININPNIFPNRTAMLHLHNMAMNRAFFWSYILQSRFIRPATNDTYDPGMMYYFLSSVADVSANPYINASSIYFSPNKAYTPSFNNFFNKTMSRFAPRAHREDINGAARTNKINAFLVEDLGAFDPDTSSKDYTSDSYRTNEWYRLWLPDEVDKTYEGKTTYQVEIRYANNTNKTFTFHGPRGNDEISDPVNWTRPYFDCGRLNKWMVAAVSPVVDIYPRHTQYKHMGNPIYAAAVVVELDYEGIDINQCPSSHGNHGPNRFAGTARCKEETTECEFLHGWGFRRGGYQCRCRPGYRTPGLIQRPYLGDLVEQATSEQYNNSFDCLKVEQIQRLPNNQSKKGRPFIRDLAANQHHEQVDVTTSTEEPSTAKPNIDSLLNSIKNHQRPDCSRRNPDLFLNAPFEVEELFESQARIAVRLANFISAFLQVSHQTEVVTGKRVADKPITEDQMFGEALAIIMGDSKIWSAGIYWDRNKFTNKTFFAPCAYKTQLNTKNFNLDDLARLDKTDEFYLDKDWFSFSKQRWLNNFDALEKNYVKIKIRDDETSHILKRFERYPTFYRAANFYQGHWTRFYYDCNGHPKQWVITYAVPFFGWDTAKVKLEFQGVVGVTMPLTSLGPML